MFRFGCDQKLTGDAHTSVCSLSEADNTRVPLLVGFSFPLLEKKPEKEKKKTEKEKKKSKKATLEEAPVADGSAEVHKKKKKVCTTPWAHPSRRRARLEMEQSHILALLAVQGSLQFTVASLKTP